MEHVLSVLASVGSLIASFVALSKRRLGRGRPQPLINGGVWPPAIISSCNLCGMQHITSTVMEAPSLCPNCHKPMQRSTLRIRRVGNESAALLVPQRYKSLLSMYPASHGTEYRDEYLDFVRSRLEDQERGGKSPRAIKFDETKSLVLSVLKLQILRFKWTRRRRVE